MWLQIGSADANSALILTKMYSLDRKYLTIFLEIKDVFRNEI